MKKEIENEQEAQACKTVEERSREVMAKWKEVGAHVVHDWKLVPGTNMAELIFVEWIKDALYGQIEQCVKIVDKVAVYRTKRDLEPCSGPIKLDTL